MFVWHIYLRHKKNTQTSPLFTGGHVTHVGAVHFLIATRTKHAAAPQAGMVKSSCCQVSHEKTKKTPLQWLICYNPYIIAVV